MNRDELLEMISRNTISSRIEEGTDLIHEIYVNDFVDDLLVAINVIPCCKSDSDQLPTKKDFISELEQHQEKYKTAHTEKVNNAYALGFRHCFHFISDRVKIK